MLTLEDRFAIADDQEVAWEETHCPLCGRDDATPIAEAADPTPVAGPGLRFAVVRCRHCSLAYTNPRPSPTTIGRFYPPGYTPHEPKAARGGGLPSRFWSRLAGHPCPERRGLLPCARPGRLLDFGCGGGSYLTRMADLGWRVTGLDFSRDAVRNVREKLGHEVFFGTLPHEDLAPGSFEAVTMWQALEHVHQPVRVLREACRLLVPGGILVVAVPNFENHSRAWSGEHWFGLDLPRHLTHFTPRTLTTTLQAAGFRVKNVRGLSHAGWTRASARRVIAAGGGTLGMRLLSWRPLARLASWFYYAAGGAESIVAVAERPS
jgi:2-polyprenyl-3-methyl-5-hydroxy-6-metoxy-1,4-benzoquinol methylase